MNLFPLTKPNWSCQYLVQRAEPRQWCHSDISETNQSACMFVICIFLCKLVSHVLHFISQLLHLLHHVLLHGCYVLSMRLLLFLCPCCTPRTALWCTMVLVQLHHQFQLFLQHDMLVAQQQLGTNLVCIHRFDILTLMITKSSTDRVPVLVLHSALRHLTFEGVAVNRTLHFCLCDILKTAA